MTAAPAADRAGRRPTARAVFGLRRLAAVLSGDRVVVGLRPRRRPPRAYRAYRFGPCRVSKRPAARPVEGATRSHSRATTRAATGMFLSMRLPVPPLGATMITTTMTAAMLGAVVAAVAGAALAPAVLPPAHAATGEPGTLAFSFGVGGSSSPYEFTRIRDVAMAPDGKIVVLDGRARDALRIFHPNGTLHAGVDFSSAPASRDKVYVAPNGSILVKSGAPIKTFDPNGVYVSTLAVQRTWGDGGSYNGHLSFAPDGNIIVIQNASRIAVLYPNGTHAFSFGQYGGYYGELSHARFVDVGPAGRFFVESGNGRIEVFHPNGTHASTASFSLWQWDYGTSGHRYNGMFEIGPSGEFIASYRSLNDHDATLRIFYPNGTLAGSI